MLNPGTVFNTYRNIRKKLVKHEQKLDDILLYIDFIDNPYGLPVVLLKDSSVMLLFELTGIDHEKLSGEEREACSRLLRAGFLQLEKGFTVSSFLDRDLFTCHPLTENSSGQKIIELLRSRKQVFWDEVSGRSFSNILYGSIRYKNPSGKKLPWTALIHEKKIHQFSRKEIDDTVEKLHGGMLSLRSTLSRFGFYIPQKDRVFGILYRLINFREPPQLRDDLSLNAQLSHSGYEFDGDTLTISGRQCCRIISIKYPPKHTSPLFLERLFDLDIRFVLGQSFRAVGIGSIEKRLQANQNIARSLSSFDKRSEAYVEEADEFLKDVKVNGEAPVRWNLTMVLSSDDPDHLDEKVSDVLTLLKETGSAAMVEQYNLPGAFFGSLPGMEEMNARGSTILAGNAGDLFSVHTLFRGDPDPLEYFVDRSGGIFSYTPFTGRENAWHMAITGPTGGGKSFLVNKLILSSMIRDPDIFVIDLSRSFSELFDLFREEMEGDTSVLTVSKESKNFSFNPFLIPDLEKEITGRQMSFCEGLLRIMIGVNLINGGNRVIISDALKQFFLQYRSILKSMGGKMNVPPLDILIPVIEQIAGDRDIPNALRYWQTGMRGELFNSGVDTVTSAKYVYFDIRDMETSSEEISAVIYTMFNKIYSEISRPEKLNVPKILFLDEAHRYLRNREFSCWIDLLIRMGRHYNLLVGIVSQSINDLITGEEWSTGVINNIKQAFFFSGQRGIEEAFSKLQMNESHISLYKNMKGSGREFLYWSSKGIRRVLKPLTDPFTYWMATTDPGERMLRKRMKDDVCGGDTGRTLEELACLTGDLHGDRTERIKTISEYIDRSVAGR
jgi:type IV secretory pathway VirB4 component